MRSRTTLRALRCGSHVPVQAQQVWSFPSRWSAPLTPCWCFHPGARRGREYGPGDDDCSAEKQKGIQSKDADSDPTMRLSGLRDENSRAHRTRQGLLNTRRHVLAARQELPGDPGRRRVHVARPLHLTACGAAPPLCLAAPWAFARPRAAPGAVCGVANALCAHRLRAVTRSLAPPGLLSRQCPRLSLARRMCAALPRARALPPFCTFTRPGASRVTGCPTKTCRLHCEPCRIAAVLIWLQQLLP